MSASTDAMYNSESRYLHQKLLIYFTDTPLEVTTANYLVSSSILEEASKVSSEPFGDITSNELSISLYNEDGLFNPQNTSSMYYGLIKKGIKIEVFIRPDEVTEWDQLGVFYVTDWQTSSSGAVADVTANDALYNVINGGVPKMPVYKDMSVSEFATMYFQLFGLSVSVDTDVTTIIPYVYTSGYADNREFLSSVMNAIMCDCFCDHTGSVRIRSRVHAEDTRATLTDNDQIITMSIKQSISNGYDSVVVECHTGQESADSLILSIISASVEPGTNTFESIALASSPALSVKSIRVICENQVTATSVSATASDVSFDLRSTSNAEANIDITGTVLESVVSEIGTASDAALSIRNNFVQNKSMADAVYQYCDKYIKSNVPTIELSVRGNPKLNLGDKIEVYSSYYKTRYTGWLLKAQYDYTGSLSSSITLMLDIREEG